MTRLLHLVLVLLAMAALVPWVSLHPLGLTIVAPCVLFAIALFFVRPASGLWVLPTLWPIVDLAPLTGWIHFPESMALVLTLVTGVGLREALRPPPPHADGSPFRATPAALLLFAVVTTSYIVSSIRGGATLPPYDPALLAGYKTPLNAVRLLVGFVQCLLLLPALHAIGRTTGPGAARHLSLGLVAGLGVAALAASIERWQFPGLTNFSSDYRTTAQFWEMHVGGATLDAWLALTFPFALAGFIRNRSPAARIAYMAIIAVAAYAILTTFSRGLYAAVAVAVPLLLILNLRRSGQDSTASLNTRQWGVWLAALALCAVAPMSFAGGGYRGLAALLGLTWLAYLTGGLRARPSRMAAWIAMLAGTAAGLAAFPISLIPKAVYVFFGLLCLAGIAVTLSGWRHERMSLSLAAIALTAACAPAATAVGIHWGEGKGTDGIVLASLAVAAFALFQHGVRPIWQTNAHNATTSVLVLGLAAALAASLGSYYVGERFSTTEKDLEGRLTHWRAGADLVNRQEDALLGIGVGRYPDAYYWSGPLAASAGIWKIDQVDGNRFASLGAPRHVLGFGELFRVSQQVPSDAVPPYVFRFRARGHDNTGIHLEICRKHLLYTHECSGAAAHVPKGDWQHFEVTSRPGDSDHTPPDDSLLFSFAVSGRAALDVDDLDVIDGRGVSILANGDFHAGTDFWFFSSDRHHLPWHAKSLPLHIWIEQGWLGVFATGLLVLGATARMLVGRARALPIAAPLTAGLAGFLVVGLFDSLLDMPRMTTIFYLTLWLALVIRRRAPLPAGI
ncbi:MAG: hypothetical protein KDE68_02965 [Rhodocyclaceae bacterium]|nr:hypothetical protein [Rhodocyclaceae bacterium]